MAFCWCPERALGSLPRASLQAVGVILAAPRKLLFRLRRPFSPTGRNRERFDFASLDTRRNAKGCPDHQNREDGAEHKREDCPLNHFASLEDAPPPIPIEPEGEMVSVEVTVEVAPPDSASVTVVCAIQIIQQLGWLVPQASARGCTAAG
jgi:hypothetical protein